MIIKIFIILFIFLFNSPSYSDNNNILIASTTSTNDTGFIKYIAQEFKKEFKYNILSISLPTGQAIEAGKNATVDILLIHDTKSEKEFVRQGFGLKRYDLMYNDFLIVGPKNFLINKKINNLQYILHKIKNEKKTFLSRGDDSGTYKKELMLWNSMNFNPNNFGNWYLSNGQGMGATLNMANMLNAFTLVDRATWIKFKNKSNLKIIYEDDETLSNQYGIILVKPKKKYLSNYEISKKFISWILSTKGREIINNFKISNEQVYYFNYN